MDCFFLHPVEVICCEEIEWDDVKWASKAENSPRR